MYLPCKCADLEGPASLYYVVEATPRVVYAPTGGKGA
jgi:hypothetical protein